MADNEQKAEQLVAEAEKKLNAKPFLGTYSMLHCGRAYGRRYPSYCRSQNDLCQGLLN